MKLEEISAYVYQGAEPNYSYNFLLPPVVGILGEVHAGSACEQRFFEVGCGNGSSSSAMRGCN